MESFSLSARLKSLRESHGYTQQELGEQLNISKQGYSHYENGTRTPDLYMLEHLAHLYNLTLDELLSNPDKTVQPARIAEEPPRDEVLKSLPSQDQELLKLFSQLTPEEQEDFTDLLSVKVQQYHLRKNKRKGHR